MLTFKNPKEMVIYELSENVESIAGTISAAVYDIYNLDKATKICPLSDPDFGDAESHYSEIVRTFRNETSSATRLMESSLRERFFEYAESSNFVMSNDKLLSIVLEEYDNFATEYNNRLVEQLEAFVYGLPLNLDKQELDHTTQGIIDKSKSDLMFFFKDHQMLANGILRSLPENIENGVHDLTDLLNLFSNLIYEEYADAMQIDDYDIERSLVKSLESTNSEDMLNEEISLLYKDVNEMIDECLDSVFENNDELKHFKSSVIPGLVEKHILDKLETLKQDLQR